MTSVATMITPVISTVPSAFFSVKGVSWGSRKMSQRCEMQIARNLQAHETAIVRFHDGNPFHLCARLQKDDISLEFLARSGFQMNSPPRH